MVYLLLFLLSLRLILYYGIFFSSMPTYCFVPQCTNSASHAFPSEKELLERWVNSIRRLEPGTDRLMWPSPASRVCSDHFLPSDYKETLMGERKRLKHTAVPSVFPYRAPETPCASRRRARATKRQQQRERQQLSTSTPPSASPVLIETLEHQGPEVIIAPAPTSPVTVDEEAQTGTEQSVQCNMMPLRYLRIELLTDNQEAVQYYTGFDDYNHFMLMYAVLGPNVECINLNECGLSGPNQLFLTMLKLRQAKDDYEIGFLLGVKKTMVSHIFSTWVNFMYFQLEELDIWPSKATVEANMPIHFKELFPTTRVILDATEVPIQKPKDPNFQSATFSSYKNKNTAKVMIGCTPSGSVSYISEAYGGSASDRQIIERSSLCTDPEKFEKGDSIMADRGIMVQDLFAMKDVKVNTPTMLKGKSQLEEGEVVGDRRIASKRIHVERVIGLAKTYKILKKDMQYHRLHLANRIINVCFKLTLFRRSIVSNFA